MKILRLRWVLPAISLFSLFSCSTLDRSITSSAKYLNSDGGVIIQAPLVAELDVDNTKRVTEEMMLTKAESKGAESEIKESIIAKALQSSGGDVMIEPRFAITKDNKGNITHISVNGYTANYSSFRKMELGDTLLLDGIYGRQQIVNVYREDAAKEKSLINTSILPNIKEKLSKYKLSSEDIAARNLTDSKKQRLSLSLSYSALTPITEGVDGGSSLSVSVGYGTWRFFYGAYFENSSLTTTSEGDEFANTDIGVFVHYNILKGKYVPYTRLNVGYKMSDDLTYVSPDYVNKKKVDYGAELGLMYAPIGRSGICLFASLDRMVYASEYNGVAYGRADDFIHLSIGARCNIVFGKR